MKNVINQCTAFSLIHFTIHFVSKLPLTFTFTIGKRIFFNPVEDYFIVSQIRKPRPMFNMGISIINLFGLYLINI